MFNKAKSFFGQFPLSIIIPALIIFVIIVKTIDKSTSWDYLAFPISCIALYYAVRSYRIAKDTLLSQKETQKNTTPIFTAKSQALVLSKIATQLIDNFCRLSAMNKFLQRTSGKGYPLPRLFNEMYVDQKTIHLELAYTDSAYFLNLSLIQQALARYSKSIKSIQHVFEVSADNKVMINNEMSLLIKQTAAIFSQICQLFREEDSLDFGEIKKPLKQFLDEKIRPLVPIVNQDDKNIDYVERLLDLLENSKDSDIYRSAIPDTTLYLAISIDVEQFAQSIKDDLSELRWKDNLQEDWFIRVLGCVAYLYHKKELKDFILISNEKKDLQ